jgi:hypothetical protein
MKLLSAHSGISCCTKSELLIGLPGAVPGGGDDNLVHICLVVNILDGIRVCGVQSLLSNEFESKRTLVYAYEEVCQLLSCSFLW